MQNFLRLFFIFSFVLATLPCASEAKSKPVPLEVRFILSEPCGLVVFVETLAGRPHCTQWLSKWYFDQSKETIQDKNICASYSKLLSDLDNKYGARDSIGRCMDLSQRIKSLAISCQSLDELLAKLKIFLEPNEYDQFAKTYKYFQNIYHDKIWQPRLERLEAQLADFKNNAEKYRMIDKLEQVAKLFNARWPAKTSFDVALIPLPDVKQTSSHGESIGKTQIVELLNTSDFTDQGETVFHELCHAIWERNKISKKIQRDFDKYNFDRDYQVMNESLATALAQGLFHDKTFPQSKSSEVWYGNEIIDKFAHGLYPLINEYLENSRSLDSEFSRCADFIYLKRFPKPSRMISKCQAIHICADINEKDSIAEFSDEILARLPNIRRLQGSALNIEDFSKRLTCEFGEFRRIVLLSDLDIEKLNGLSKANFVFLKKRKCPVIVLSERGSEIIFCFGKDLDTQKKLALDLLNNDSWPEPLLEKR